MMEIISLILINVSYKCCITIELILLKIMAVKNVLSGFKIQNSVCNEILEKVRRNKDIVITRPDNENRAVVMDRVIYNEQMYF